MILELLGLHSFLFGLIIEGSIIGIAFISIALMLREHIKLKNLKVFYQAKGGKIAIICDRAKNIWFVPLINNQTLTWIKEFGVRTFDREATYFSPQFLTNIGIFASDSAVNLPVNLYRAVNKNKTKVKDKDEEEKKTEDKLDKLFTQVDVEQFITYLGRVLEPLRLQSYLEWRSKRLSTLPTLDKTGEGGFNKKWLLVLLVIGIIAVGLVMFIG